MIKYNLAVRFIVEKAEQLKGIPRALRIRVAREEVEAEPAEGLACEQRYYNSAQRTVSN
jgi:hypothetical protein